MHPMLGTSIETLGNTGRISEQESQNYHAESPDNFSSKMINDNNDILIVLLPGVRDSHYRSGHS